MLLKLTALALVLSLAAPGMVPAQAPGQPRAGDPTPGPGPTDQPPWEVPFADLEGEDVVGRTLTSADGEEIGSIEDLVIAEGAEQPEIVIGVGGFLGIGQRLVTIPVDRLRPEGDGFVASLTSDEIEALPPYRRGRYRDWDRRHAPRAEPLK